MRKIMLAAAILPLLGGVALAGPGGTGGSPNAGHDVNTAVGPTAYADWQQRWAQVRQDPAAAALLGLSPAQPSVAAQSVPPSSALPSG